MALAAVALVALALVAVTLASCAPGPGPGLPRTRGYILISIDTLRADHLGCYGYGRDTSPFIDSLAARGALFENAYAQAPGTLPSHMSIFTGLYPAEHDVQPPDGVLSVEIPTLPEVFREHGFRTAGHTEGGYMHGGYGFARGFEEFSHEAWKIETDVARTLERGRRFLAGLGEEDAFFLFLHTYAVHDPYPDIRVTRSQGLHEDTATDAEKAAVLAAVGRYWKGEPPAGAVLPNGPGLTELNRRGADVGSEVVDYYRALYDASIRYVDDGLRRFFADLEVLGLADEVTVILTSDHGEEFFEHGRFLHTQIYRETLHVPLLLVHPDLTGPRRIPALVESLDIPATLYDLAGIEPPGRLSGSSLAPLLEGAASSGPRRAFAEDPTRAEKTLVRQDGQEVHQLVWRSRNSEEHGTWIADELVVDTLDAELVSEVFSFAEPRRLEVWVDGERVEEVVVESRDGAREVSPAPTIPTESRRLRVELPGSGKKRVTLRADGCTSPFELGLSEDRRCLSIHLSSPQLWLFELFDSGRDPRQALDLSFERPELTTAMLRALGRYRLEPVAPGGTVELDPELEERLRALGYLP